MTPAQIFGIVVRSFGLLLALYGTFASCIGIILIMDAGIMMLLFGFPAMCVGLWLLRGPQPLIAFAYPEDRPEGP